MPIHAAITKTVVDAHAVAIGTIITGIVHRTRCGRLNRRTHIGSEINAIVKLPTTSERIAAHAVIRTDFCLIWNGKTKRACGLASHRGF